MPAGYFELVPRTLGTAPRVRAALIDGTGVTTAQLIQPDAEITLGQQLRQRHNAKRALPPGWALTIGAAFHASSHGPLGLAAMSVPTLGDSLTVIERFAHARNPSYRARKAAGRVDTQLVFEQRCTLHGDERLSLLETILLSVQGIVEVVLGRPMCEARFELAAPPPPYAARYPAYFHAPVRFESRCTAVVIPSAWMPPLPVRRPRQVHGGGPQARGTGAAPAQRRDHLSSRLGRPSTTMR